MIHRGIQGAGLLLLLFLLSAALPISGFAPTVTGQAASKVALAAVTAPQRPTGFSQPRVAAASTPRVAPTAVPPTPAPTLAPHYVPPRDPPAPLHAADLCAESHGQVSVHQFYSQSLRRNLRYRIYLPPCYAEAGRLFPTLYVFHGLNYGDSQWDSIGLDELADAAIRSGEMAPLIIVMPNIWGVDRHPDGGPGSVEAMLLDDLLPHVERRYCTWNQRDGRAIGGLSRGAFWALEIAFRHPDLFASVGGHSPAVFWDNAPPQYNPYYLADDAPGLESLRIYLDVGEQDWLAKWVARFLERLDERGLDYAFSTAPGDHGYAYWRSQARNYLDFYTAPWPTDWRALPTPFDCVASPDAPGCRNGLGLGRPCDVALP